MLGMFFQASAFNQGLPNWNVGNVIDMSWMFSEARAFNQDLSKWNVGKVNNMEGMFRQASAFNQALCGHTWIDSKANKRSMFRDSPGTILLSISCDRFQPQNRKDLIAA